MSHTWRLSRIQEELEELDFPPPPPPIAHHTHSLDRRITRAKKGLGNHVNGEEEALTPGPHGGSLRRKVDVHGQVADLKYQTEPSNQGIYDKVVIKPAVPTKPTPEQEGLKKITEKYDSLGRNGMGLLKAYVESQQQRYDQQQQQQQQQQQHRSRSFDSMLDCSADNDVEFRSPPQNYQSHTLGGAASGNKEYRARTDIYGPAANDELTSACGYRTQLVSEASVGVDPSFPPPPTQDELTNASGIVTKATVATANMSPSPLLRRSLVAPTPPSHASANGAVRVDAMPRNASAPASLQLQEKGGLLSESEVLQVEMFYRSHKTEVWVSQATAHLHLGSVKITTSLTPKVSDKKLKHSQQAQQPRISSELVENWKYVKIGVPVFLLDSGASRRDRKLYIILAEKGTGFTLWKDKMDHLSGYRASTSVFHTMHLSDDHNNMAGFAFDDARAASDFLSRWRAIASNPEDDILNLSGKNKKRKKDEKKQKGKFKLPQKSAISTPCCFTHVTKLDRTDGMNILGTKGPRSATRDLKQLTSPVKMSRVSSLIPQESQHH